MKIYNEIRIDIETGETLYEDSYEYDGPVALCGGGGGGDSDVNYQQSKEQRKVYNKAFKIMKGVWADGGQGFIDQYADVVQPTAQWYQNLSPEYMAGVWEPYNMGAQQMLENMGAQGVVGSGRGGYSGAASDALGRFYADASQQVGLDAWNTGAAYRNMMMFPYTSAYGALGGTYGSAVVDPGNASNPAAGALSGAVGGGTLGYMIGSGIGGTAAGAGSGAATGASTGSSAGPWGAAIGAVAGGLLGWLGS